MMEGPGADSEEKHEPVSDIDTVVVVVGLKALDPEWPIREAIGKMASNPSPMNLRTSPPCFTIAGTWQSKYRLSISTRVCGGRRSARRVNPRISDSQIAA